MNEHELGRTVVLVVWRLLLADFRQVPNVDSPVGRRGRKDRFGVRRPGELDDLVRVGFERVQLEGEIAQVPESDRLVARTRQEEVGRRRRKGNGVDLGRVGLDRVLGLERTVLSRIPATNDVK